MHQVLVLILAGATSAGAYWVGHRGLGLSPGGLRAAIGRALDIVGASVMFFGLNLALGLTIVAIVRGFLSGFLSVYPLTDVSLLLLSVLQGLVFEGWLRTRRESDSPRPSGGEP